MTDKQDSTASASLCEKCGTEVRADAFFCVGCGAFLRSLDADTVSAYATSAQSFLRQAKNWIEEKATEFPTSTQYFSLFGLLVVFCAGVGLFYVPYVGLILGFAEWAVGVPFMVALNSAMKESGRRREERLKQEAIRRRREEEERRRRQQEEEEELRRQQLAYQQWFNNLSPAEQQVELLKQMMVQQEQQMQDLMSQNAHLMNQNAQIAKDQMTVDALRTWMTINAINHANDRHHH